MTKRLSFKSANVSWVLPGAIVGLLFILVIVPDRVSAQTDDPPKREVAAEFATLNRDDVSDVRTELGVGGRFTYNLNKNIALEAAAYFFPRKCFDCLNNGRVTEVVGGLKAGKRFKTWGIFAKARPGIVRYSTGTFEITQTGPTGPIPAFPFIFRPKPLTNPAVDVGGVLEFYPSRRIVTRFDFGDTIVHVRRQHRNDLRFDPATNTFFLIPITLPGRTTHNFQFSASVGFRW